MIPNLSKTPLMAVFYAATLSFSGVFIPFSQSYDAAAGAFTMPQWGNLLLLGYALLISVVLMLALSSMRDVGILSIALLFVTATGFLWVIPSLPMLWYGDRENIVTNLDLLLNVARGTACTLLLLILAVLLRKKETPKTDGAVLKLKVPGFILKILALPFLYLILYLAAWYFLGWRNDAIRLYLGGPAQAETIVKAILENLLLVDPMFLPFVLMNGLAMVIFALPLMTRLASKRSAYVIVILLMTLSSGMKALIPVPWIPAELRMPFLVRDTALFSLYGVVCAALLHLSYKKQSVEAAKKPSAPISKDNPQQQRQVAGVSAKQAAEAVRSTMRGS